MKIKSLALAAALLGATGFASAATYNLGDITATGAGEFSGKFGDGATIDDTWIFSITGAHDVAVLLGNNFSRPSFAIGSFAASGSGGSLPGSVDLSLFQYDSYQTLNGAGSLSSGTYSVHVTGTSKRANTIYSFTVDVAPVPEPETYALLLAGLGVVGAVARRRKAD